MSLYVCDLPGIKVYVLSQQGGTRERRGSSPLFTGPCFHGSRRQDLKGWGSQIRAFSDVSCKRENAKVDQEVVTSIP